jgi:Synergist-CTERM protein sorting domain-containing protein
VPGTCPELVMYRSRARSVSPALASALAGAALVVLAPVASAATRGRRDVNLPPSVPVLNNPGDQQSATTTTPAFSWQRSTDPEGDTAILYEIEVHDSAGALVASVGVEGTVTSISTELVNRATYAWRARAADSAGATSDFSPANTFTVNAPVDDPEVVINGDTCNAGGSGGWWLALAVVPLVRRRRPRA